MRKKIIFIASFFLIIYFAGSRILVSSCDSPIHYRIDMVDTKFNLPKDKFIEDAKKAADIWNKAIDKNLFVYDPKGDLSINLIYDERQLLNSQINNLEGQINNEKGILDPKIVQFEKDAANFKAKLTDLNNQIESWNKKVEAPTDIYNQLIQEQKDLQIEANALNERSKNLNLTAQKFNAEVGSLNQQIDVFNIAIGERPEEGIYIGDKNRIEIYFDITTPELIHTIAHEMGHARGLDHTTNPKSIMYSKTNEILIPSKEDLDELKFICAKRSLFDTILLKINHDKKSN